MDRKTEKQNGVSRQKKKADRQNRQDDKQNNRKTEKRKMRE